MKLKFYGYVGEFSLDILLARAFKYRNESEGQSNFYLKQIIASRIIYSFTVRNEVSEIMS